jgi:3-hydroxyacyl-CoA dehydrogenase
VTRIAIVGTGRMARDLGAYYLGQGAELTVAGTDPARLDAAFAAAAKAHRRLARVVGAAELPPPRRLLLGVDPPAEVDVALECTAESREAKRAACAAACDLFAAAGVVATNSSSLLPREVAPGSVGAHHFHPTALTRFAEIVADDETPEDVAAAMCAFAEAHGITCLREAERNAFAANRLLLPLQNEAFRLLRAGVPAPVVDGLTASPLLPVGQLALLDGVGLDVVRESVENYAARMPSAAAGSLDDLRQGLAELARLGKRGRKNGDGLLVGSSLPWPAAGLEGAEELHRARLGAVLRDSCRRMLADAELSGEELRLVLTRVFGADDEAIGAEFPRFA